MPALPDSEPAPVTWLADRRWLSYHLYTPGDPREALLGFVRPVVAALYAEGRIDSFFFLRYIDDGGPHLRLRLRLSADEVGPIARRLAVEADRFAALCGDSAGGERRTALTAIPFEFEIERYGGPAACLHSLDFFAISSAFALDYHARYGERPKARQRTLILCALLWQAWGFAASGEELLSLLDYRVGWRPAMEAVIAHADGFFEGRREMLVRLVREQLESLREERAALLGPVSLGGASDFCVASRQLSTAVQGVDTASRRSIGCSQMHMTGNRLGLTLAEESYTSQLLYRTAAELAATDPRTWSRLEEALARRREARGARPDLGEVLRSYLAALFPLPAAGAESPGWRAQLSV